MLVGSHLACSLTKSLDVHLPVSSPSIPSSTSSFLCVSDCPSSASVRLLDQAARMLQQFPSSLYSNYCPSILDVPNANLMACSIVVSIHFFSFSFSVIIGFWVLVFGRLNLSTIPHRQRLARPMAGRLHQGAPVNRG